MSKPNKNQIPDDLKQLLDAADKQRGFPAGTMASVMKQEIGGQFDKFLGDPTAYHYGLNAEGRRVAGHTGKVSTAFGPFGILESTGRDPGFGVVPLKDKSIGEQVRFAADYLQARSKGGDLAKGLAGYGEGEKYSRQVMARIDKGQDRVVAPPTQLPQPEAVVAAAPASMPVSVPMGEMVPQNQEVAAAPVMVAGQIPQLSPGEDPWGMFLKNMQRGAPRPQVRPTDLQFGGVVPAMQIPQFQFNAPVVASARPNFEAFGSWGGRA